MLGHIGGGAAIFAAERDALDEPQDDERDRRRGANVGVGRQEPDQERRASHDRHGKQEAVFAPSPVTEGSEDQRADGAHERRRREGPERQQEPRRRRNAAEELLGKHQRERAEQEEIVPLEGGADRCRCNHPAHIRAVGPFPFHAESRRVSDVADFADEGP
jgi:hypothetical protein